VGAIGGSRGQEAELDTRSRRVPEQHAATVAEVRAAIESLSPSELVRLEMYARLRVKGLGRKAAGRNYEDLLGEALTATVAGATLRPEEGGEDRPTGSVRRWNKAKVTFVGHLIGAMRSIAHHWRVQFSPDEPRLESELVRPNPEGGAVYPFDLVRSGDPSPDRALEARREVDEIEQAFADDHVVSLIIDGLRQEMSGQEIREALGLSQAEYETAMKRLRRKARAIATAGGSDA
jgi:hypothetical protein